MVTFRPMFTLLLLKKNIHYLDRFVPPYFQKQKKITHQQQEIDLFNVYLVKKTFATL